MCLRLDRKVSFMLYSYFPVNGSGHAWTQCEADGRHTLDPLVTQPVFLLDANWNLLSTFMFIMVLLTRGRPTCEESESDVYRTYLLHYRATDDHFMLTHPIINRGFPRVLV